MAMAIQTGANSAMAIWAVRPLAKEMEKLEVEVAGVSIVENKEEIVSV